MVKSSFYTTIYTNHLLWIHFLTNCTNVVFRRIAWFHNFWIYGWITFYMHMSEENKWKNINKYYSVFSQTFLSCVKKQYNDQLKSLIWMDPSTSSDNLKIIGKNTIIYNFLHPMFQGHTDRQKRSRSGPITDIDLKNNIKCSHTCTKILKGGDDGMTYS